MKLRRCAIAVYVLIAFVVCKEDGGSGAPDLPRRRPTQPLDTITFYDSLLTELLALQDAVFDNPRDTSLAVSLYKSAFDTGSGAFLTVGKATFNPEFPEAAQVQARKRSALYVGERWSLYLKAWHIGKTIRFGAPISGTITYSKELYKMESGDTLYQLILVPIGSVVLENASPHSSPKIKHTP